MRCEYGNKLFLSRQDWIDHLGLGHGLAPHWASFECPLCLQDTGDGKFAITGHLSSHMEEISLAALPVGADEDQNDSSDSESTSQQLYADVDNVNLSDGEDEPTPQLFIQNTSNLYRLVRGFVSTSNATNSYMISDRKVLELGFNKDNFEQVRVESIETKAGTIHPMGSISLQWHVDVNYPGVTEIEGAKGVFDIVPEDILSASFAPYEVVFSTTRSMGLTSQGTLMINVTREARSIPGTLPAPPHSQCVFITNTPFSLFRMAGNPSQKRAIRSQGSITPPSDFPESESGDADVSEGASSSDESERFPGQSRQSDSERAEIPSSPPRVIIGKKRQEQLSKLERLATADEPMDDYESDMTSDGPGADFTHEWPGSVFTVLKCDIICAFQLTSCNRNISQDKSSKTKGLYTCPFPDCAEHEQGLAQKKDLHRHMIQAHGERPYRCPHENCPRSTTGFGLQEGLDRHMRGAHGQGGAGRRFVCPYEPCSHEEMKIWPRGDNFRSHLLRVHKLKFDPHDHLVEYMYNK